MQMQKDPGGSKFRISVQEQYSAPDTEYLDSGQYHRIIWETARAIFGLVFDMFVRNPGVGYR